MSKEEYKSLKKQDGYSVNRQTSYHNRATIKRIKTEHTSEEFKTERGGISYKGSFKDSQDGGLKEKDDGAMIQIIQQDGESKGEGLFTTVTTYYYYDKGGLLIEISYEENQQMS